MSEHKKNITPAEVEGWFKAHRAPWPNAEQCTALAERFNRMRWAGELKHSEPDEDRRSPVLQDVIDAAKLLQVAAPEMLALWENVAQIPAIEPDVLNIADAPFAMKALADALDRALPYIEWPLGFYERRTPKQRPRPKPWHSAALVVANFVVKALIEVERERRMAENPPNKIEPEQPGLGKETIAALVIAQALRRMGHTEATDSAVAKYLESAKAKAEKAAKEAETTIAAMEARYRSPT